VNLSPGSTLSKLLGHEKVRVPALHHQAVQQPGTGLATAAWADDQVIEALELEGHRFTVGIQWHPEEGDDLRLLQALVAAATPAQTAEAKPAAANGRGAKKQRGGGRGTAAAGTAPPVRQPRR